MLTPVTWKFHGWWDMDIYRQTQSEPIRLSPSDMYKGHLWASQQWVPVGPWWKKQWH